MLPIVRFVGPRRSPAEAELRITHEEAYASRDLDERYVVEHSPSFDEPVTRNRPHHLRHRVGTLADPAIGRIDWDMQPLPVIGPRERYHDCELTWPIAQLVD